MCGHEIIKEETIKRSFLGETFSFNAKVCQQCGAVLWDNSAAAQFSQWLSETEIPRHKLQVQFKLSERAQELLRGLVRMFPGADDSDVIRALTSVYMEMVLKNPETNALIEQVTSGDIFSDLNGDRLERQTVQFKSFAMLDICEWAELADVSPAKFVEEAVLRMLSITIETNKAMRELWESTLRPKVEMVLKAAA